jgi:hypothetical protein
MLPPNHYETNKDTLPATTVPLGSVDDIVRAVDVHQPAVVFLFSGYLLSQDGILSRESLDSLLQLLRQRGCRIVTSDPFLGLASRLTVSQINIRMTGADIRGWYGFLLRLGLRLLPAGTNMTVPSLEDAVHLYPTAAPDTADGVTRRAFFNPHICRPAEPLRTAVAAGAELPTNAAAPTWLFILSSTDLHLQRRILGTRGVIRQLAGLLWYTHEAGRRVTLIAPRSITQELAARLPDSAAELLSGCPFAEFEARVLAAEYVFYWNAFSFSQLARLANEQPVFLFDRGHLARTIKPFYEVARACHFGGWEPTYLDPAQVLRARDLEHLAAMQKPALRALRERWQSLPTPDDLISEFAATPVVAGPPERQ